MIATPPSLKQYLDLSEQRRELKATLDKVEHAMSELEQPIIDHMAEEGMSKITIDDRTVSIRVERWPKYLPGMGPQERIDALRACGWDYMVQEAVNTQSLRSRMIEAADADGIPKELAAVVELSEIPKLSVRKG